MPCLATLSAEMYNRIHPSAGFPSEPVLESKLLCDGSPLSRDFGVGVIGESCVFNTDRGGTDAEFRFDEMARL